MIYCLGPKHLKNENKYDFSSVHDHIRFYRVTDPL